MGLESSGPPEVDEELLDSLGSPTSKLAAARHISLALLRMPWGFGPAAADELRHMPAEGLRILAGRSQVTPARGDRRFEATAWQENPAFRRLAQAYLAMSQAVGSAISAADLDWGAERRIRLAADNVLEALAPTNFLATNPEALKRLIDTGGKSVIIGLAHFVRDMASAPRIPKSVDESKFEIGGNLALTPGSVVLRTPMFELLQFAPATPKVHKVPLLLVSSMVNKYYILDVSPGRSLIEHLVAHGQTVFAISWRNPEPEHTDWNLDRYCRSVLAAMDAIEDITEAGQLNVVGLCAAGFVVAALSSALAQRRQGDRIRTLTLSVCPLDSAYAGAVGAMVTRDTEPWLHLEAARRGYVKGHQIAGSFAWLRPNEGVWSNWVNNYLLGMPPPAVDILYWAADSTNVPWALNRDMVRLSLENAFVYPSELRCLGAPLDLSVVKCDAYIIAAKSDHITPWPSCYAAADLLGGRTRFILSGGGHISATVNPPGRSRGGYWTGPGRGRGHEEWLSRARKCEGSWWNDWIRWLRRRAGPLVAAPTEMGSADHSAIEPAPGSYVRVRGR